MSEPQFIPYSQVREQIGVSRVSLWQRVTAEGIQVHIDPSDRRRRLIAAEDARKLMEIRPAKPRRGSAA